MIHTNDSTHKNKNKDSRVQGQAKSGHDNLRSHSKVTKSESLDEVRETGHQVARKNWPKLVLVPPVPHAKYFLTWILVLSVSVKRPLPCCVSSCSPFSYSPHLISQEEIQHGPLYLQAVLCLWACVHSGRVWDDGSAQKTPPAPWVPAWRPAPSWEALSEGSSDSLSGRARPEGLWLRKVPLTRVDTQAKGIFTKRS